MRITVAIACLLFISAAHAQPGVETGWNSVKSGKHRIQVSSNFGFQSASLRRDFLWTAFTGDVLDKATINRQYSDLQAYNNRLGVDGLQQVQVDLALTRNLWIVIGVTDEFHVDATFSNSLFQLIFMGNSGFNGDTAFMPNERMQALRYQQMFAGVTGNMGVATTYTLAVAYLNGEQWVEVEAMAETWLSPDADSIYAAIKGRVNYSDTSSMGFMAPNGYGLALNFGLAHWFSTQKGRITLSATVRNLGMMQWGPYSRSIEMDTGIIFTGIELSDIGSFTSSLSVPDSMLALLPPERLGVENRLMPGWAHFSAAYLGPKWSFNASLICAWRAGFKPMLTVEPGLRIGRALHVTTELGYGGYAYGQLGAGLELNRDRFAVKIKARQLQTFLLDSSPAGFGIHFNLNIWI